jgi:hypothetical protein
VFVVLTKHDPGDLRRVRGCCEDKPPMVEKLGIRLSGRRAPLQGDHLRGPGLADDVPTLDPSPTTGAVPVDHVPESVSDGTDRLRGEGDLGARPGRLGRDPAIAVIHRLEQMGGHPGAAIRYRGHHDCQRQRCDAHGPLPDRHRNRLARIPRFTTRFALPRRRGHQALDLMREVNTAEHAQPERGGPLVNLVDFHLLAQRVKIGVA